MSIKAKIAPFFAVLLVSASPAMAEKWVVVSRTDTDIAMVDLDSVTKSGDQVQFDALGGSTDPMFDSGEVAIHWIGTTINGKCSTGDVSYLAFRYYSKDHRLVDTDTIDEPIWEDTPANSHLALARNVACGQSTKHRPAPKNPFTALD